MLVKKEKKILLKPGLLSQLLIFLTHLLFCLTVLTFTIALATSRYALDPLLFTAAPSCTTVSLTVAASPT